MEVEVKILPSYRETETVDKVRSGSGTNGYNVTAVNLTVTVHILILDVTRHIVTECLLRTVAYILPVFEQTKSYETLLLVNTVSCRILVRISVELLVGNEYLVLTVSDVSSHGQVNLTELLIVAEVTVETVNSYSAYVCPWRAFETCH